MTALQHYNPDVLQLYLLISAADVAPKSLEESVLAALKGGVTCIQLRDKQISDEDFLAQARLLKPILSAYNVPLIINDRLHLVEQANADGLHLGQSDSDPTHARQMLGDDKIIGLSITEKEQLEHMSKEDIDYVGLYPIFATATKLDAGPALGLKRTTELVQYIDMPVVGIGGITATYAKEVLDTGCVGVSVISAICKAEDIEIAACEFIEAMK
jgi:thiamine-phosphate pyrophosphorylase